MTVFWVIAAVGAVLLVLSVVAGELFDGVLDAVDVTGGWLSTTAVGAFVAASGLTGALWMTRDGATPLSASLAGVVAGLGIGALAGFTTRSLMRSSTDQALRGESLVGLSGVVITRIPEGGYGEVTVTAAGHPLKLNARADTAVPAGTLVVVTAALSSSAVHVALPTDRTDPAER